MIINEIFYSLQGEGVHMGKPSIFIRLSKCNLRCSFCDTEFDSGHEMSLEAIHEAIKQWPSRRIIWTGGEPTLQLTDEVVAYFKALGYHQSIETNGTRRPPRGLDYITCSPKKEAMGLLQRNFPEGANSASPSGPTSTSHPPWRTCHLRAPISLAPSSSARRSRRWIKRRWSSASTTS